MESLAWKADVFYHYPSYFDWRNINFGFVLAMTYFPTAVAIPVTLASVYNQPLASVITWLFNRQKPVKSEIN